MDDQRTFEFTLALPPDLAEVAERIEKMNREAARMENELLAKARTMQRIAWAMEVAGYKMEPQVELYGAGQVKVRFGMKSAITIPDRKGPTLLNYLDAKTLNLLLSHASLLNQSERRALIHRLHPDFEEIMHGKTTRGETVWPGMTRADLADMMEEETGGATDAAGNPAVWRFVYQCEAGHVWLDYGSEAKDSPCPNCEGDAGRVMYECFDVGEGPEESAYVTEWIGPARLRWLWEMLPDAQ